MISASSSSVLPVSMLSSLPPTSLLPPSLIPPLTLTGQSTQQTSSAAVTATSSSSPTPTATVPPFSFASSTPPAATTPLQSTSTTLTAPTASPTSPSRVAVAVKAVSDGTVSKAAATVIPINDATVSAAAMLMSIASTNPESSTSTAASTVSSAASTTSATTAAAASSAASSASSSSSPVLFSAISASSLSPPTTSSAALSFSLSTPASNRAATSSSAFISSTFSSLLSPRSPYQSFSPSPFLPTSLASPTLSSGALFSTSSSLFSPSFSSLPSLSSTIPSPLIASIRPGPLTPATTSSLVSSLSNPTPKPKPTPPTSALDRFTNYLHPLLTTHPGSLAPSITLPQLRVLAANNFHQLIALAVSVHFNPRRPYAGHRGKEEKLIICRNGWNALRNFISAEREKAWRAEMSGLSVREQRAYKKKRREDQQVANAAIREGRMAKFIDIANEYGINYSAYVKLGDEHSGRLRFRQMKAEQKDAAANALVNSSALISASNVNVAISSAMPAAGPMMANALPTTLAAVVNEQPLLLAAPLTPTSSTSPTVAAASLPVPLGPAPFTAASAGQSDVLMAPPSATSSSGSGSDGVAGSKRRLEDEAAEVSDSSKRLRLDDSGSGVPILPPLPTDELSSLPLLSPNFDTAMASSSTSTDGV